MRQFIILAIAAIASTISAAEPERFTINGNVSNVPDGTCIKLYKSSGNLLTVVAKDTVTDGLFCLTDTISGSARRLYMSSDSPGSPSWLSKILVAPGSVITVTGQGPLFPLWRVSSNIPRQESVRRFVASTMPEFEDFLKFQIEESALIRFLYGEKKGAEEYVKPTWHKIDSLRQLSEPLRIAMDRKKIEYMAQAPVDEEWLEIYRDYVSRVYRNPNTENADAIKNLYTRLSTKDLATDDGLVISQMMDPSQKLREGDLIPRVELTDTAGTTHTLDEFPGKYILLDFWSQGCGPCIQSFPEAEEVAEMYASRLAVVGISQDPFGWWKKFINSKGLKGVHWNGYTDNGMSFYDRFGSNGIPTYVLISPDQKIIAIWNGYGPGSLKKALQRHLPSPANPE